MESQIERIKERMESALSCSAHNIDHVMRVFHLCKLISVTESNVNMAVLEPAALLHDIARTFETADQTGNTDHAILGSEMAGEFLEELEYPIELIQEIQHCITTHRYRSGNEPKTIEAKILFDADKLDAIGAVGIARTFMLAGQFGQRISFAPSQDTAAENTVDNGRIKDTSKHTPFMEYEIKFKKIPARLYTQKGKDIGEIRLNFMKDFFTQLNKEL